MAKSRAVLREVKDFASRVNMPHENSHEQTTLIEKNAGEHVEKMLGYSGWPTPYNWDDYGYGMDDHYRKVTSHIHNRKAITESRSWAQEWEPTVDMTLEAQALRVLSRDEDAYADGRHQLAEAVVRRTKEPMDGGKNLQRDPACGAGVWVGRRRVTWVDERSSDRVPLPHYQVPQQQGDQSQPLSYKDWQELLKKGDSSHLSATKNSVVETQNHVQTLTQSISTHYAAVLKLARQVRESAL